MTSGIRIGTPAITSRGFDEEAMKEVAAIMALCLKNPQDEAKQEEARQRVAAICEKFPMYPEFQI